MKQERLRSILRGLDRVLVAFSGGLDSTYLLSEALDTLGPERVLAVTAESPSLARRERADCEALARRLGAPHRWIRSRELDDPAYAANPSNRCYFCKSELFRLLSPIAAEDDRTLVDGYNASDRREDRPGHQASLEFGVRHPLDEAGLTKDELRELSRRRGLPTWHKPASPCLASRIPHGTPVTVEALARVERAEDSLRALGLRVLRVRHHGEAARIELGPEEHRRLDPSLRAAVAAGVLAAGYTTAEIAPDPYRPPSERVPDLRPQV